jgi:hypothetical protein
MDIIMIIDKGVFLLITDAIISEITHIFVHMRRDK